MLNWQLSDIGLIGSADRPKPASESSNLPQRPPSPQESTPRGAAHAVACGMHTEPCHGPNADPQIGERLTVIRLCEAPAPYERLRFHAFMSAIAYVILATSFSS